MIYVLKNLSVFNLGEICLNAWSHLCVPEGDDVPTVFTARCTIVQSAVLRSHIVCMHGQLAQRLRSS